MINGDRHYITDFQLAALDVMQAMEAVSKELHKRSEAGEDITYAHFMAYLAEEITRNIPPGTHFLRRALDTADEARKAMKAEQEAWNQARESGFYSLPAICKPRTKTERCACLRQTTV